MIQIPQIPFPLPDCTRTQWTQTEYLGAHLFHMSCSVDQLLFGELFILGKKTTLLPKTPYWHNYTSMSTLPAPRLIDSRADLHSNVSMFRGKYVSSLGQEFAEVAFTSQLFWISCQIRRLVNTLQVYTEEVHFQFVLLKAILALFGYADKQVRNKIELSVCKGQITAHRGALRLQLQSSARKLTSNQSNGDLFSVALCFFLICQES